jgi:hypothetical protein
MAVADPTGDIKAGSITDMSGALMWVFCIGLSSGSSFWGLGGPDRGRLFVSAFIGVGSVSKLVGGNCNCDGGGVPGALVLLSLFNPTLIMPAEKLTWPKPDATSAFFFPLPSQFSRIL